MTDEIKEARKNAQDALIKLYLLENPQSSLDILAFPIGKTVKVFWPLGQKKQTRDVFVKGYYIADTTLFGNQLRIIFDVTIPHHLSLNDMIEIVVDDEKEAAA